MRTVEEIALEVAKYTPVPTASGFTYFVANDLAIQLCARFLARVDQERVKDAVRYCYECGSIGEIGGGFIDCCPDGNHAQYVHRGSRRTPLPHDPATSAN